MASPFSLSSTVPITLTSSLSPCSQKTSQLSIVRKRRPYSIRKSSISCEATNGEGDTSSKAKFDRRDLLVSLGGLYGVANLASDPFALAAPIEAPDLSKCGKADLPEGAKPTNCCPPTAATILDYKFPKYNTFRVRPAAHLADDAYIAKYEKAIKLMKALPDTDPRSFTQQASVHCAYCDGAYHQVGFPDLELQVHNSWLFFPFHRYYLYFFERILGKLIDDPTFALPFWNWDSAKGMPIPAMFANTSSPLYDTLRDAKHQPPNLVDLDFNGTDENLSNADQISSNYKVMYRQMVSNAKTPQLFMGSAYHAGDNSDPGAGSLENNAHGLVHFWTGDRSQPNTENMGNFYSAGKDPIFYAHHSNVDRLWTVWKILGGKRRDFTDSDWLDASFIFYDENAKPVKVKVRDCLDTKKLGYVYQKVDNPWLKTKPQPKKIIKKLEKAIGVAHAAALKTNFVTPTQFPIVLDKTISMVVQRPKKSRSKKQKEDEEEVLVIDIIEFEKNMAVKFDVFINDEDEVPTGPDTTEFAGTFVSLPHKHKHHEKMKTRLRLGLTDLLEDLDADDDETVVVTLVPRYGTGVSIGSIKIDFASD
ncbi:polyphenol oxidase, chloroplastic-like [Pistacia vera]|uniref:polyphenol oxidase, chloroplastic-like n=1 Tax=Pistacia vera TaxID=55513 RepID=UPI001263D58C|nr:polyphenol oxidase, chloroplastic-like [Pistacia vera]